MLTVESYMEMKILSANKTLSFPISASELLYKMDKMLEHLTLTGIKPTDQAHLYVGLVTRRVNLKYGSIQNLLWNSRDIFSRIRFFFWIRRLFSLCTFSSIR